MVSTRWSHQHRRNDGWIELAACVKLDLAQRDLCGECRLVRTLTGDGVEGVGNEENAGEIGDGGSREASRITASVEPFVVEQDRRGDLGVDEAFKEEEPFCRVAPHLLPLLVGERSGFVHNVTVDMDLADIVQMGRHVESSQLFGPEAESGPKGCCDAGNTCSMIHQPRFLLRDEVRERVDRVRASSKSYHNA